MLREWHEVMPRPARVVVIHHPTGGIACGRLIPLGLPNTRVGLNPSTRRVRHLQVGGVRLDQFFPAYLGLIELLRQH
jgi:hypothetical protein